MDAREKIYEFINEQFLKEAEKTINDDTSFIEEGVIDSVGVVELVAFLEETFGFRIEDEELIPENLDSVQRLVTFVQTKMGTKTSPAVV